jgi:hypothetical protein
MTFLSKGQRKQNILHGISSVSRGNRAKESKITKLRQQRGIKGYFLNVGE